MGKRSLETDNHSAVEEICSISCSPKVHYRVYKTDTTDLYADSLVSNLQPRNNFLRIVLMLSSIYYHAYANLLKTPTYLRPPPHTHTQSQTNHSVNVLFVVCFYEMGRWL